MQTPTTEPKTLTTGETWAWSKTLADYPAGEGWTLKYSLLNASKRVNFEATADGDTHTVSVSADTTGAEGYAPAGTYTLQGYVEHTDGRRFVTSRDTVRVVAGAFGSSTTAAEARTDAQQALDAARAALKQYTDTNGAVSEYEIDTGAGKRRVKYRSTAELQQIVNYWAGEVQKEINAEKRRQGKRLAGKVLTRFGR